MDGWDRIEAAWGVAGAAWRRFGYLFLIGVVFGALLGLIWAQAR